MNMDWEKAMTMWFVFAVVPVLVLVPVLVPVLVLVLVPVLVPVQSRRTARR
jgi:hypothetical protein